MAVTCPRSFYKLAIELQLNLIYKSTEFFSIVRLGRYSLCVQKN